MVTSCTLIPILGAPRSGNTGIGETVDRHPHVPVLDLTVERDRRAVRRL